MARKALSEGTEPCKLIFLEICTAAVRSGRALIADTGKRHRPDGPALFYATKHSIS